MQIKQLRIMMWIKRILYEIEKSLGQSTIVRDVIAPLEWVRHPRNQRVDNAIVSTYFSAIFYL
jgi:hypothetical protein